MSPSASVPVAVPTPDALARWSTTLRRLDAHREHAFAAADPGELTEVYVPGELLNQDAQALSRHVPAGCGLSGLRTTYRLLQASTTGGTVELTAQASLAAATVRCAGRVLARTATLHTADMHIELVRTTAGYRISAVSDVDAK